MKKWKIPVFWTVYINIKIEVGTLGKIIRIAKDKENELLVPDIREYIDDS